MIRKKEKGITLISLLVTVAVLTILVAVAISTVEDDGIISETKKNASDFEIAQEKENLQRVVLGWSMEETDTFANYFKAKFGADKVQLNADESITVEVESGNKYVVTEEGEVTALNGTGEEPQPEPDTELVTSIALDKTMITKEITSGSTATETITATLTNATGTLTWTSSNTSVASLSGSGNTRTITFKAAGSTTITVSYGSYSATCKVTVTEKAISLTLNKTTITKQITSGSTATETITATLTNATGTLTWTSSNTSVASLSGSGNTRTITFKAAGSATITVSYGSYSATCKVTVTEKAVSLTLNKTTITKQITSGSAATETITATLTNATGTLTWTSSNTSVASLSGSGNTRTITFKAAGSATITVSYGSYSATCKVTVTVKESESGSGTVSITSAEVSPTDFTSASNVTINLTANIEKSVANEILTFTYKFYRAGYNDTVASYISSEDFVTTSSDSTISLTKTISSSSITTTYNNFLVTLDISDSSGNIKASKNFDYFQTYNGVNYTFLVSIPCLPAGTMVTVEIEEEDENGKKRKRRKQKKIEDLTYDDDLVVWDFDNGCFTTVKPLWLMRKQVADEYNLLKFSDGSELKTIRQHRIFNKELGKFTYPMTEETPIGTTTYTEEGKEVKLVSKEVVKEPVEYYNVISDYHMNVFAEGILTSCRLSNLYEIKDMKYVKDGRELVSREEYKDIPDEYFYGLRLAEQPREINRGNDDKNSRTLKEYVLNCVRTQKKK